MTKDYFAGTIQRGHKEIPLVASTTRKFNWEANDLHYKVVYGTVYQG